MCNQPLVPLTNIYFAKGYHLGRVWSLHGKAEMPIDDAYLIENIRNICEHRLHYDPEWLSEHVGFLMGMVAARVVSEE